MRQTLNLTKKSKGNYFINAGNVEILVSNPFIELGEGSNSWQLVICFNDNEVVNNWFKTKKQAVSFGTEWVLNNL